MKSSPHSSQYVGRPLTRSSSPCLERAGKTSQKKPQNKALRAQLRCSKGSPSSALKDTFCDLVWFEFDLSQVKSTVWHQRRHYREATSARKRHGWLSGSVVFTDGFQPRIDVEPFWWFLRCWTQWVWKLGMPSAFGLPAMDTLCGNDLTTNNICGETAAQHIALRRINAKQALLLCPRRRPLQKNG